MSYQREIEEAVIATYPVDLFPYNKTAKTMRKMAPAIASIVLPVIERAVEAERQFILNILDGIDIADEEMGNNGGGTKAIRLALKSRIITPLPDKE